VKQALANQCGPRQRQRPLGQALLAAADRDADHIMSGSPMWDVGSGTQRDNHVYFYNRYLLLLKEHNR
jgi:hypothetical protein